MPNAFALFGEINVNADKAVTALKRTETAAKTTTTAISKTEQAAVKAGNNASRGLDRMRASSQSAARSASSLGSVFGALTGGGLALAAKFAINTATDFDSLKRAMVAVTGSAANASTQMARLKELAKAPGLGFKEAIQGSVNLQAAGLAAETAERALSAFGNALATVGKGKAELDGVITALSQIQSKGKVSAEEINQLAERLPQIRVAMQAAFGTADTEALQKMGISAQDFIKKVITEFEKLPKVVGGAQNSFDNFKETVEQAMLPIGDAILKRLTPALDELAAELQKDQPNISGAAKKLGERIGESMGEGINAAMRDIAGGGSNNFLKTLGDFVADMGLLGPMIRGALKDAGLEGSFSGFIAAIERSGNALNQFTGRGILAVANFANQVVGRLTSLTLDFAGAGLSAGKAIVQGIINGIASLWGALSEKMTNLAAMTETVAKARLESRSPSKVFFRIGQDVAQGFIDGIQAMNPAVFGAISEMVTGVMGAAKKWTKKDAPGIEIITDLVGRLNTLVPQTLEQELAVLKASEGYKKLNAQGKIAVDLLGKELLRREALDKFYQNIGDRFGGGALSGGNGGSVGENEGQTGRSPVSGMISGPLGGWVLEDGGVNPFQKMMEKLKPQPELRQAWDNFWATMNEKLNYWKSTLPSLKQSIGDNLVNSIYAIGDVFGQAVANWDGTAKGFFKSLAQGFKQMVGQIIGELVRLMVIKAIMNLIGGAFGGSLGGLFGGAASSGVAGAGNSVGGLMGGGGGYMFASGGRVQGPGSGTSDSIMARLSNGEFVMSARAVKKWGSGFFEGLNSMTGPALGFAGGGMVGGGATYNQQSYSTSPTINVYMPSGGNGNLTKGQVTNAVIAALHKSEHRNR